MSVDPDEFERARALLDKAMGEEFADYLVHPVELEPGHWALWPERRITLTLEEPRYSTFGQPGGGTGYLQALVEAPYGIKDRVKPKPTDAPFDEKVAKRAARAARKMSEGYAAAKGKDSEDAQRAYLAAYAATSAAGNARLEEMWPARAAAHRGERWEPLHKVFGPFLDEEYARNPEGWAQLRASIGEQKVDDLFFAGYLDALDDWAAEAGILERSGA